MQQWKLQNWLYLARENLRNSAELLELKEYFTDFDSDPEERAWTFLWEAIASRLEADGSALLFRSSYPGTTTFFVGASWM